MTFERIKRRWRALFRKGELERELEAELRFHLERDTAQNLAGGMSPEKARYAALRSFGGVEQAKEECRDTRGVRLIEEFWRDLRYSARMLSKRPGFTSIVVVTLALGIGANTAIFSVVNAVLLRPLPYDESDGLVFLSERGSVLNELSISYPNFADWRNQNRVFEKIGVARRNTYNLTGVGEAEQILVAECSADLFSTLRVNATLGRLFTDDEDKPGGTPVVVLSYGLWQRRFGGQSGILNKALTLSGKNYLVIGVMPQGFQYPGRVEMWVPVGQLARDPTWQQRGNHPGLFAIARLKPGATLARAQADMDNIAANLEKQYPDSNAGNRVSVRPLLEVFTGEIRETLWVLFGAVGFVLLIACANIANLLLARARSRQKEMTVRAALGAGRWRIARQLLTESVLLALVSSALALLVARCGIQLILHVSPNAIPRTGEIGFDWKVLAFTLGVSSLTAVVFGLVQTVQVREVNVQGTLNETGRGTTSRNWLRSSLVVVEVATTMVLLIGAGLMIWSFHFLKNVNPGFSYEHLTSFSISLPLQKYATSEQQVSFFNQLLEQVRDLPGVESAAAASGLPLGNNGWQTPFLVEAQPTPPRKDTPVMEACTVTPDYFCAMKIPLLRGRYFTDQDNRSFLPRRDLSKLDEGERLIAGANVIVIDEEFARRYWPNEDAVGKRIRFGADDKASPLLTVVGEVGRVKMEGLDQESKRVQGYLPFAQIPFTGMTIIIKASGDPNQLIASVREQVKAVEPDQPIYNIRTMYDIRADSIAPERLDVTLLSIFAGIALILAVVGIYGVMSYAVTQRTHEIGIRMAIGAQPRDVFKMVLGQGMSLVLIGLCIGIGGAIALTRVITSLLFGVGAKDPLTFLAVAALLSVVAFVACYIPARRATRVDPLIALRCE